LFGVAGWKLKCCIFEESHGRGRGKLLKELKHGYIKRGLKNDQIGNIIRVAAHKPDNHTAKEPI
jgi:hypothetical protein